MLEVAMISTGEEVLHGDIDDTNAAWLSRLFFQHGFSMTRRVTVGDQFSNLSKEIESCSLMADIIVVNGGLGPTSDDLTAASAAMAADVGLEQSDYWVEQMQAKYAKLGRVMPKSNLKQAMLPEGAELIDNPIGTACGFMLQLNRARIFFTPGVPSEFKLMVEQQILPRLKEKFQTRNVQKCHRLFTYGLSESGISDLFKDLVLPPHYELGYRSSLPFIEVKLFCPETDPQSERLFAEMSRLLSDNIVGNGQGLVDNVANLLVGQQQTLSTYEQSSGGFIINWLQDNQNLKPFLSTSIVSKDIEVKNLGKDEWKTSIVPNFEKIQQQVDSDYCLVSGPSMGEGFTVALIDCDGMWIQQLEPKRSYASYERRWIIATVLLDMLRRKLEGKAIFGCYESLNRINAERIECTK